MQWAITPNEQVGGGAGIRHQPKGSKQGVEVAGLMEPADGGDQKSVWGYAHRSPLCAPVPNTDNNVDTVATRVSGCAAPQPLRIMIRNL